MARAKVRFPKPRLIAVQQHQALAGGEEVVGQQARQHGADGVDDVCVGPEAEAAQQRPHAGGRRSKARSAVGAWAGNNGSMSSQWTRMP